MTDLLYEISLGLRAISVILVPLLVGVLLYFRMRHLNRWAAQFFAFLVPPAFTIIFLLININRAGQALSKLESGCGMPFLGFLGYLIFAAVAVLVQVALSFWIQAYLFGRARRETHR